ncbi:MAG: GAF domain-containing protein [Deltaproteobacteria bacterium]|nr:GAF domain-containing protein [Deltaproteobacteria bacterium]
MPFLLLKEGTPNPGKTMPIHRKFISIGKSPDNDIVIEGTGVEENHAQIIFDGKDFTLHAVDRKAKVLVNGRAKRQVRLAHGDNIQIGNGVLVFNLYETALLDNGQNNKLEYYRKVYEFTKKVTENTSIPDILDTLMREIMEITGADKGFLVLFGGDEYHFKVARNIAGEKILDAIDQVSDTIISRVIETGKPLLVSDALSHEEFRSSASVINLRLSSVLCAPLIDRGEVFGIIYLGNDNIVNLFDEDSLEVLKVFAGQASLLVLNALKVNDLRLANEALREQIESTDTGNIVGACRSMMDIFEKIRKVAPADVSVLITGETGTGKELVARELHRKSHRNKGPFIAVNCGALPENLLESELFGHMRGAFTGAVANRIGKFQAADKGTLLLDEIGEMSPLLQVKLLRAIEERQVTRVGSTKPEPVDIRIIAATNRNLQQEVANGAFREDLFYRLNVINLQLPPLRERGEDIVLVAKYFLEKAVLEMKTNSKRFSPAAIKAMRRHSWPGNVRELENRVRKAVVLSDGPIITPSDMDLDMENQSEILTLSAARDEFTRRYIEQILERNQGNRTKAAKDLGVDPRTIFRYLEKDRNRDKA